MLKIGITGKSGFIGTHLANLLNLEKEKFLIIPFEDNYFNDNNQLKHFVKSCDVIVHLAAMNRHSDQNVIYETNIRLASQLINAMEETSTTPHVLFASSIQEERDNLYGKSKREGRKLFMKWAEKNHARFTGFVIPNVFGPFCNPFYNSVVATFCYQLTHGQQPKIEVDASLQLIFVTELVKFFHNELSSSGSGEIIRRFDVPYTSEIKVSEILELLSYYKSVYLENNAFPVLKNKFEIDLFNTFRSYMDYASHYPVYLKKNQDSRGVFMEAVKTSIGGQFSCSVTFPGITRGNHYHTRKIERFTVIRGKAQIEMRRVGTTQVIRFELDGENPSFVDMPVWYTHNITNTGEDDLITLFWINEFFDPADADTYYEVV
jgi:UDP-2-acetamido-2,6-beta-L-arabino-hexul-4-ose reductase